MYCYADIIVGLSRDAALPALEYQLLADPLTIGVSLLNDFCQEGCLPGTDELLGFSSPHMQLDTFQGMRLDLSAQGGNPSHEGRHETLKQLEAGSRAPALAAALMCMPPIGSVPETSSCKRMYPDLSHTAGHHLSSPSTSTSGSGVVTSSCFTLHSATMMVSLALSLALAN